MGGYNARLIKTAQKAPNFTGAEVSHGAITIYGVAYPTQEVKDLLGDAPPGVRAEWRRASYSLDDLSRAADLIGRRHHEVTAIDIPVNGAGLVVGTLNLRLLNSYHPGDLLDTTIAVKVVREGLAAAL